MNAAASHDLARRLAASPTVIDLFAGPGGWEQGARDLGLTPRGLELDTDACDTARAAGHYRHQCNVASMNPRDTLMPWGNPAGILGSPPCPGFSRGGLQLGVGDARLVLAELAAVDSLAELEDAITRLDRGGLMKDGRTLLALEPLRWCLALGPRWAAWEQVPSVLPLWDACARILRGIGYTVATGVLHAEAYGVAQHRARAVLVARSPEVSAAFGPATLPAPTHSRYHTHAPARLDDGVPSWRSMSDAIPAWSPADRVGFLRRDDGRDAGLELAGTRYRARDLHPCTRPAPSLTEKARSWQRVVAAGDGKLERVTLEDAAALQGFPSDYPWRGSRTSRFRQIANAVPPLLARAIVAEVAGLKLEGEVAA